MKTSYVQHLTYWKPRLKYVAYASVLVLNNQIDTLMFHILVKSALKSFITKLQNYFKTVMKLFMKLVQPLV